MSEFGFFFGMALFASVVLMPFFCVILGVSNFGVYKYIKYRWSELSNSKVFWRSMIVAYLIMFLIYAAILRYVYRELDFSMEEILLFLIISIPSCVLYVVAVSVGRIIKNRIKINLR